MTTDGMVRIFAEPPVDSGTPQKAGAATTILISSMFTEYRDRFVAAGTRINPS